MNEGFFIRDGIVLHDLVHREPAITAKCSRCGLVLGKEEQDLFAPAYIGRKDKVMVPVCLDCLAWIQQ